MRRLRERFRERFPEEWTTVDLDVRAHAEEIGIDLDRGGILKLFAAVHETIAAHGELRTQNLGAMECRSADSAKDQTEETYVSRNG